MVWYGMEEPGDTIVVAAWPIVGYQLIVVNKYQFSLWTVATWLLTPRYVHSKYKKMHHPNLKVWPGLLWNDPQSLLDERPQSLADCRWCWGGPRNRKASLQWQTSGRNILINASPSSLPTSIPASKAPSCLWFPSNLRTPTGHDFGRAMGPPSPDGSNNSRFKVETNPTLNTSSLSNFAHFWLLQFTATLCPPWWPFAHPRKSIHWHSTEMEDCVVKESIRDDVECLKLTINVTTDVKWQKSPKKEMSKGTLRRTEQ